ncbi:hypothetical protein [Tepidiforma sp.]|uniref:hypothetical protein n=1 Tax=Tepidiforma sp. TaxID=2682230 RepID=UPI002ADE3407|nr:hypothetical protein [Tepidiforma sp.]
MNGDGERAIERALALARERLLALERGELEGLDVIDRELQSACTAAAGDLAEGDRLLLDELLAIQAAADGLLAGMMRETSGRMARLRSGQAVTAAYRAVDGAR